MEIEQQTSEVVSLFSYLIRLIRNPVETIKQIPKIRFSSLIAFQILLCCGSVVISNLLSPYAINVFTLAFSILGSIAGISLLAMALYYFFSVFFHRELSFQSLFTLVLFSYFPFAVLHLFYYYFSAMDLIGMAASSCLMVVGLVENYQIAKRAAIRVMSSVFAIFAIAWIANRITRYEYEKHGLPQTLDSIEREVQSQDLD